MKCPKCQNDNPDTLKFCGECGTRLALAEESKVSVTKTMETPQEELTRGTTLADRYEILEELGRGGMGNVYRVVDKKINEEVALKLLKPEIAADKKTLERFSNELKLARKIVHKNVGRMYHLGEERETHFITMEYVRGQDLKGLIRQTGQLAVGTTINIAKQICEGLSEAHRLGVVHRDLKPSNIMIDKDGSARIMDFGIARTIKGKGITGAGVIIGTPEYMSPEQVEGKELDQRSDIYSLGIILYEMVTGRTPFEGDTPLSIAVKHKTESPPDPKDLNSQIPDDLSCLIHKCLEKNKETRYQSASELLSELTNIEKGIPTTGRIFPRKKPRTSKEITVTFRLKKLLIPALALIAVIIIALFLWRPWSEKEVILTPTGKTSLAVIYFENKSGNKDLDHWRDGLTEMIIADISQSKFINVLGGDKIFTVLKNLNLHEEERYSSEDLAEIARQAGASHIFRGNYITAGKTFIINTSLHRMDTGEIVRASSEKGEGLESIPDMVDRITIGIKKDLNLTEEQIADDYDKDVGKITTSSPEAYKLYAEGRKYHRRGDWRKSIEIMEKAIAIDPEFAMAYRSISSAYSNLGLWDKMKPYDQKALELIDRLSERERYIIQGWTAKNRVGKVKAYNKLVELYPDDPEVIHLLGQTLRGLEEWDKAIELYIGHVQNKDESYIPYWALGRAYRGKGMYEKARDVYESYIKTFSDHAGIRREFSISYLCQGQYDLALVQADKAFSLAPKSFSNFILRGVIFHLKGDLIEAEEEYKKLFELEELTTHLSGRYMLGSLYLLQGKFEKSKEQVDKGIELASELGENYWISSFRLFLAYLYLKSGNPTQALKECDNAWLSAAVAMLMREENHIYILHLKGLAYLMTRSMAESQRAAAELKQLMEEETNKMIMRYDHHLRGMIELESQNYSKATEYFKNAISLLPFQSLQWRWEGMVLNHALFIQPLALVYYEASDLDKAQVEYEKITNLTTGRLHYGDIFAKSFYMLGKICEQQGDTAQALENYEKFLDLWKDADPGIAEVEDAKKRLAGLKVTHN